MRRTTRYVIGIGLAVVLAIAASPRTDCQTTMPADDGTRTVDVSVIVQYGPGIDPTGK